ncbi:MAG TPA: hypothetical protein VIT24_04215, partial [Acidimicrobiales bacterium]
MLLQGEEAVIAVLARSDRAGWPDPMVQASRIPADTGVVLLVTSHRLLVLSTQGRGHVGEPYLGVGPHQLLALDATVRNPMSVAVTIQFLDGSLVELTTPLASAVPGLRSAFARLLPELDDAKRRQVDVNRVRTSS